jgi:hypothetical protein
MDWTQTLTIIISIITIVITSVYFLYHITDKRIDRMEEHHRDDIRIMDSKWDHALQRMDEKWERLFERLLIQDQKKSTKQ